MVEDWYSYRAPSLVVGHGEITGMSLVNLHVLEETDYGCDAFTTSTLARVQVGNLAWQWQKQLVFVRLQPSFVTDPIVVNRFRNVLTAWRPHYLANNPVLFHADLQGEPFAMFEHDAGRSLESVFGSLVPKAPLARSTAEQLVDALYLGLRSRHELGFAHGAVGLDRIAITDGGVTLGIGTPWDPSARPEDDLARAEQVSRQLLAMSRTSAAPQGAWLELSARLRPR